MSARPPLRVAAVEPEAPGVVSVVIAGRHLDELRAESGHFFRWRFLTRGLWWVSAPYSLSAAPRPDRLRITVKEPRSKAASTVDVEVRYRKGEALGVQFAKSQKGT